MVKHMHGLHDDEAGTRVFIINLPDPKRSDKKKSRKGIIKQTVQASVVYIQKAP